ncbi:MAG: ribosome biogenesis GTP-binding protein YihA/YsxC [Sandaracinaceae bacterium]
MPRVLPPPTVLDARFIATATAHAQLPAPAFAEVAFAGRSNVGKSTLINRLLGRKKLVRTSSTPGCTRGLAIFRATLRFGDKGTSESILDLVDLPGYGYAKRSKTERASWGKMVEGLLTERAGLRGAVVIVDIRRGVQEDDEQLLEFLDHADVRPILVATKLDKLASSKRQAALDAIVRGRKDRRGRPLRPAIGVSSITGDGVDALWDRIARVASLRVEAPPPAAQTPANEPPAAG